MATLAALRVKIIADIGQFKAAMEEAQSVASRVGKGLRDIGSRLTARVTLPILGMGAAALKAATDLNAAMANVASLGEEAARNIGTWKTEVQNLAVELGKSTGDLAEGLYQVVSAFGASSESIQILEINAKAAAAGLAQTAEAINLTSAVTKAYGDTSAAAVRKVADLALKTVQLGQTTFPELAASIGRVTPLAASLGVRMEELFAVLATATGVTGSAAEVNTQMRAALQALMAPTTDMAKLMKELGYESGQAMIQELGFVGALQAIVQYAEKTGKPLQKFIGSVEGMTLALALSGGLADSFTEKLAAMENAAGAMDEAFAQQTQGINKLGFALAQLKQMVLVTAQRLGDALAPAVLKLVEMVRPWLEKVVEWVARFRDLDERTQAIILGVVAFAAALGPILVIAGMVVSAIGAIAGAIGALLSPLGLVIVAVGALAAGAVMHFKSIRDGAMALWAWLEPKLQAMGEWLAVNLPIALQALAQYWKNVLLPAIQEFWAWASTVLWPWLQSFAQFLVMVVGGAIKIVAWIWKNILWPAIKLWWAWMTKAVVPLMRALARLARAVLGLALRVLAGIWQNVLLPAIQKVTDYIAAVLEPLWERVTNFMQTTFGPAVQALRDAFSGLRDGISQVVGWIEALADKIMNLELPDWLMPGSPTPWEIGLWGIHKALIAIAQQALPSFVQQIKTAFQALESFVYQMKAIEVMNLGNLGEQIQIAMEQIQEFFGRMAEGLEGWLANAVQVFLGKWQMLWITLQIIWQWMVSVFEPWLEWFAMRLISLVGLALQNLALLLQNVLWAKMQAWHSWMLAALIPLLLHLAKMSSVTVGTALKIQAWIWGVVLKGAIAEVVEYMEKVLLPLWQEAVKRIYEAMIPALRELQGAMWATRRAVGALISAIRTLKAELKSLNVRGNLAPGSPPPFEIGLWGIYDAMRAVKRGAVELVDALSPSVEMPAMELSVVPAGGGRPITLNFHYSPAISLGDEVEAERVLAPWMEATVKRLRAEGVL